MNGYVIERLLMKGKMSTPSKDGEYSGIIDLPHHVSDRHPQMSMESRAAQFGAFDALSGIKGIEEAAAEKAKAEADAQMTGEEVFD